MITAAQAQLDCPSVAEIKQAQMTNIKSACVSPKGCDSYGAYGLIEHNGEVWSVGTGEFHKAREALPKGQSLLDKAEKPWIMTSGGKKYCVYYASYWYNLYVGAIPYKDMPLTAQFMNLSNLD